MSQKNISEQIKILFNQYAIKNFDNVISKCKILIKKNPEYIILYNLIGSAYQSTGDYLNANKSFKDGLKFDPSNLALMNNLAMSYKNLLKYQLAEKLYVKILDKNNKYINAYINYGNLKRDLNSFSEAIELYEKALELSKDSPVIYYSLALAHQGIGNFDKAIFYSNKTLEINPKFTRADHLISQSTKYTINNNHYKNLKDKLKNFDLMSFEAVDLYFSLAKAEEDIGNIKEASDYLIKGNNLKKKLINYNLSDEISLFKDIKDKFSNQKIFNNKNENEKKIIFILGMPRSGTSLVEQIITSHSEVYGGGELPIMSNIIKYNFVKSEKRLIEDFDKIINDPLSINNFKSEYLEYIKNFRFKEKYITDKAPLNFRWIGFIKTLFPDAQIIHCVRDPKNNCLSLFKNNFEGGLNFTYNQDDLVKYYNHYNDLIGFWKNKYPDAILDVQYENLISDNEIQIKKIIEFCNLAWEDKCLAFHKNRSPIKTMSTAQARKPIYKSSVNAFEKFKNYLTVIEKNL